MYIRSIAIAGHIPGILFKTLHWPGASTLLMTGLFVCAAWFLIPAGRGTVEA
jgi:hypothetical protein